MADPLATLDDLIGRYGGTAAGLLIGTLGKYGLTLSEGRPLKWKGLLADLLLQGVLGLIAIAIGEVLGLTGNAQVFVGALAALNSDRLVRFARDRFMDKVEKSDLGVTVKAASSTAAIVPAGVGDASNVLMQPGTDDTASARAGTALRTVYRPPTQQRPPLDQIELLRRLDGPTAD